MTALPFGIWRESICKWQGPAVGTVDEHKVVVPTAFCSSQNRRRPELRTNIQPLRPRLCPPAPSHTLPPASRNDSAYAPESGKRGWRNPRCPQTATARMRGRGEGHSTHPKQTISPAKDIDPTRERRAFVFVVVRPDACQLQGARRCVRIRTVTTGAVRPARS